MTVNKMITKIKDNRYTLAFVLTAINESLPKGESCEIGISFSGEFILIRIKDGKGIIEHSDSNFTDFFEYLSNYKKDIGNVIDKKDE